MSKGGVGGSSSKMRKAGHTHNEQKEHAQAETLSTIQLLAGGAGDATQEMEWSATPCSPSLPGDVAYAPHTLPCTPMHTQIDQAARAENIFFGLAKSLADGTTEVLPRRGSELGGLAPLPPRYDYESVSALDMNSEDIDSRPPQFVSASTCVLRARTCLLLEGIPAVLTAFSSLLFGNLPRPFFRDAR